MANMPQTRPDTSGGFMLIKITDGTHTHRARYHLQDFNVTGTDLPYGVPGNQTEADVQATFTALATLIQPWYNAAWTFTLDAVYRNQGPDPNRAGYNLFQEIFGYTVPAGVVGSSANASTAQQQPGMIIYNFRTMQGGRARAILTGSSSWAANTTTQVVANAAGTAEQKLIAYLSGTATGVVGHDGAKFVNTAHLTTPYNRRLRRRYNLA